MAQNINEELSDRSKKVLRIRELFHGRFTNTEIEKLLQLNDYDQGTTVFYILSSDTQELSRILTESSDVFTKLNYIRNNDRVVEDAKQNHIGLAVRQFTCPPCDNMWWRLTPRRKPVSRCKKCQTRYDPVPEDVEFGSAVFVCENCNHEFRGFGQKSTTMSPCYRCNTLCYPVRIIPPDRNRARKKGRSLHSCDAPDCPGYVAERENVYGPSGLLKRCVHPRRRNRISIYFPCMRHRSTGSTVETFLTQAFANASLADFSENLESIAEDDHLSD
ncbi:repressor of yield of DENV protein homolog [Argonauta hians]